MVRPIRLLALDIDGVLTDGTCRLGGDPAEAKRISFHDLDAVTAARRDGLAVVLVTGEDDAAVDAVAARFRIEGVFRGVKDKLAGLESIAAERGVELAEMCYVGDSDRDAIALAAVGLGLAPSDATPAARAAAHRVLRQPGGAGAVAETVRLLSRLRTSDDVDEDRREAIGRILRDSLEVHRRLVDDADPVLAAVAGEISAAIAAGRKLLLLGNGGSAADAQHVAGELVGRFARESEPFAAIALTTDTSTLTCIANDWSYDQVFVRQVRALARPGDVVAGISTSGRSPNVLETLRAARDLGAVTIGFTGSGGGSMVDLCDLCFRAPSASTPRIQELHILAWHAICELVESELATGGEPPAS